MCVWYNFIFIILVTLTTVSADDWQPTSIIQCRTNDDCQDNQHCCSVTPALGKRTLDPRKIPNSWDGMVHYCLPWKNESATWCELRLQFNETTDFYVGLCPCGSGLQCVPTQNLDPIFYPKDRFGQCVKVTTGS